MSAIPSIDATTLNDWIGRDEVLLIDVREANEHARAHIPAAVLMPLSSIATVELPDAGDKKIAIVCATGARSAMAAERLFTHYYDSVYNVHGGMMGWQMAGLDTAQDETTAAAASGGMFSMFGRRG